MQCSQYVVTVNVVTYLFALITKDPISASLDADSYQERQETMKLRRAMVGAG